MAFTKIKQTIDAFRQPQAAPQAQTQQPFPTDDLGLLSKETEEKIENFAVDGMILVLIYIIAIQIAYFFRTFENGSGELGLNVGTAVGIIVAFTIGHFHDRILNAVRSLIPERRIKRALHPYFGSKLAETIRSLRNTNPNG